MVVRRQLQLSLFHDFGGLKKLLDFGTVANSLANVIVDAIGRPVL